MKTLLITGGYGFIGCNFIRLLSREKPRWRIVNLDLLTYAGNIDNLADLNFRANDPQYRFVQGDIADLAFVRQLFETERPDGIVNFAAETHVDRSLLNSAPFVRTNIEGVRVLLEVAAQYGIDRFLQVSTDEVYGSLAPNEPAFSEHSPLLPNSPYAASKAAADLLVRAYHRSYRIPTLITRCGNNYGPYQFPEKFLPLFITNAMDDQPLPLYGDGKQIRDWIHVEDHVRAVLHVLEQGVPGEIYNVSADGERMNQIMAEWVLDMLGKPRELICPVEDRPGHDRRYSLNASKIRSLGWEPSVPLEQGLSNTIDWYRSQRAWWERIKSGEYRKYYSEMYGQRLKSQA
ncbi:MAG TPA: dTDP-glucose 4,6-dehydratase [Candidatus Binatia bacterium]|nr:dTDP-glucose 4,6-dehydratase [Candidatus Binatia bacterium]